MKASLISALGIIECVILRRIDHGVFESLFSDQDWFYDLFPQLKGKVRFSFGESSPYLLDFFIDAEELWSKAEAGQVRSGLWSEQTDNQLYRLEAVAAIHDDECLLIICNQQQEYARQHKTLQVARELLLANDKMLAQYDYMHERLDEVLKETEDLQNLQSPINLAIEKADYGVMILDAGLQAKKANPSAFKLFDLKDIFDPSHPTQIVMELFEKQFPEFDRVFATSSRWTGELFWHCPPHTDKWLQVAIYPIKDAQASVKNWLIIVSDISRLKFLLQSNERLSLYDTLTGLPNRQSFWEHLEQSILTGSAFCVLYLDIKHFKRINELYGHKVGDEILSRFAERISPLIKRNDLFARIGGDEFAIVLHNASKASHCEAFAQQLFEAMEEPFFAKGGQKCNIGLSIGVSQYPQDAEEAEDLMRYADLAAYTSKTKAKSNIQFYCHDLKEASRKRIELESALRDAIKEEEFELFLQPMLDLDSGQIIKAEALLRWHRPGGEIVSPDVFIPIAEQTGLIVPLGNWVISRAGQILKILQNYDAKFKLSINLSPRQIQDRHILEYLQSMLEKTGINAETLELELTEGVLVDNYTKVQIILEEVRKMGMSISIDDFGTGYSSLAYLQKLPIDHVKIDRTFVQDLDTNENDKAIILAVIAMAHSLKLGVIAEGVETQQQRDFLHQHECDSAQGYLFSKPVPLDDFCQLLLSMPNRD